MRTMLHICLIALAALWGCAKEAPVQLNLRDGAICWNASVDGMGTKAYPDNPTVYSISNTFGSFAMLYYGDDTDWGTASYQVYIPGQQVRYFSAGTPMWSTLDEYYWPQTANARLHFASYSPYLTLHNYAKYDDPAKGIEIENYTVPADIEDQNYTVGADGLVFYDDDLMVSDEYDADCAWMQTNDEHEYGFDGVPTLFRHVMSRVNVSFVQNNDFQVNYYDSLKINIYSVKLNGIYTRGSYAALASGDKWSGRGGITDGAVIYDDIVGSDAISTNSAHPDTLVRNYIVLPQTIAANQQEIEIFYRISAYVEGYVFTEDVTEKAWLNAANRNWEESTDLTYTITLFAIRELPIQFTATCEPWVDNKTALGVEKPGQNFHLTEED